MKQLLSLLLLSWLFPLVAQDQLYKVTLVRAKPGALLDVIEVIQHDLSNYKTYLEYQPYLLRHSQGDHWDLMIIHPIDQLDKYFGTEQSAARFASKTIEKAYGDGYFDLVSFQEEAIVNGPPIDTFEEAFESYRLFHIEIFTSLAGKQNELLKQRNDENMYYAGIDHRPNFVFQRIFGPSWDIFTIGFYEDLHDFAGPAISFEEENRAALDAGFEGVNFIGSYMRSLIAEHHDTLAWKVSGGD